LFFSARELVLAKFTDGNFYRAMVINASDFDAKVIFVDYGSECVILFEEIMQMPARFLHTCCSHTVELNVKSKRPMSQLDCEETREALMRANTFVCSVERIHGDKYSIVVDDSLLVFKS